MVSHSSVGTISPPAEACASALSVFVISLHLLAKLLYAFESVGDMVRYLFASADFGAVLAVFAFNVLFFEYGVAVPRASLVMQTAVKATSAIGLPNVRPYLQARPALRDFANRICHDET
jgi:hypothetical protein